VRGEGFETPSLFFEVDGDIYDEVGGEMGGWIRNRDEKQDESRYFLRIAHPTNSTQAPMSNQMV
jgi:hypothetical protein